MKIQGKMLQKEQDFAAEKLPNETEAKNEMTLKRAIHSLPFLRRIF